ncbi:MAG: two-component system NtrC family sensor kinase, partial [Myxococcota bacterium]
QLAGDQARRHVSELQARTVDGLALSVDTWLSRSLSILELQGRSFDPLMLDADKRRGYLQLLYQQTPAARIVQLTARGELIAEPVYLRQPSARFPDRTAVDAAQLAAFQEVAAALQPATQIRVGPPYRSPGRAGFSLPLSLPVGDGAVSVKVELALDELSRWLGGQGSDEMEVGLLDSDGELFLSSGQRLLVAENFRPFAGGDVSTTEVTYATAEGTEVLASTAAIPRTGWTVVAAAPMAIITAAQRSVQARTAYIAAVLTLVSLVWGIYFAREIVQPIVTLKDAALGVAEGQLGVAVPVVRSVDEVSELSVAFNHMSHSLARSAEEITQKNAKIESFNRELQARVEQRTRQLQQAQAQLVRTERLAAVGELSAGIAHELNNPMAGILGLVQLLRTQQPDDALLRSTEEQALRCRDILSHLNQLTSRTSEAPAHDVVEFGGLLQGVLVVVREQLLQRGVTVLLDELPTMNTFGDRAALGRAISTMLLGLRGLYPASGGELHITAHTADGQVGAQLTAVGAEPPGSDDWMASGLGLWVARQIFRQHQGGLVTPEASGALQFVIWLPESEGAADA